MIELGNKWLHRFVTILNMNPTMSDSNFASTSRFPDWRQGWQNRVQSRVTELGYPDILTFLQNNPDKTYVKLAKILGPDFAGMQLIQLLFTQATTSVLIREAARDYLMRELIARMRHGWGRGIRVKYIQACVFADWITQIQLFTPHVLPQSEAVWEELVKSSPPLGWRPTSLNDPILLAAFDAAWP